MRPVGGAHRTPTARPTRRARDFPGREGHARNDPVSLPAPRRGFMNQITHLRCARPGAQGDSNRGREKETSTIVKPRAPQVLSRRPDSHAAGAWPANLKGRKYRNLFARGEVIWFERLVDGRRLRRSRRPLPRVTPTGALGRERHRPHSARWAEGDVNRSPLEIRKDEVPADLLETRSPRNLSIPRASVGLW